MPPLEGQGDLNPDTVQPPSTDVDPIGAAPTGTQDVTPATTPDPQSSGGDTGQTQDPGKSNEPQSMAEAITAALKAGAEAPLANEDANAAPTEKAPKADSDNATATQEKPAGTVEGDGAENEDDDPSDEELASYKPATQKRIKKLLSQRNAYRREAQEASVDAGHYRNIRQFMAENNLEDREVAELFELGAHLKSGEPERLVKFLQAVMPRVQAVMEATGYSVPADLRERVTAGEMTEDAAKQFGRERAARAAAEERARRASQSVQSRDQMARVQSIQAATAQWEQHVRATDPDFDLKAGAMKRAAQALVAERGLPQTPEQALEYAQAAYEEVNQWFAATRPAPKATRPAPASGPSASRTGLTPAPTSLAEAIKWGLEAGARR